jgi:hypothetical protein
MHMKSLLFIFLVLLWANPVVAQDEVLEQVPAASAEVLSPVQEYLEVFDSLPDRRLRNPFEQTKMPTVVKRRPAPEPRVPVEPVRPNKRQVVVFDGSKKDPQEGDVDRLPSIKVTGLVEVGGRMAASAVIENLGSRILRENDKILLGETSAGAGGDTTKWILIKRIDKYGMTIVLDDNTEITGKYF